MTEPRPRLIKRQQPHIETLQVSVQVVRIGPKQMTLAVFRQLKNEDLVDPETLELRGVPWGTVQYNPGDCPQGSEYRGHLHVVWQRGEELRRCCFPLHYFDATQRRLEEDLGEAWCQCPPIPPLVKAYHSRERTPAGQRAFLARAEAIYNDYTQWGAPYPGFRAGLDAFARGLIAMEAAWPSIQGRKARWREHVEEIEALPQLFIAV